MGDLAPAIVARSLAIDNSPSLRVGLLIGICILVSLDKHLISLQLYVYLSEWVDLEKNLDLEFRLFMYYIKWDYIF